MTLLKFEKLLKAGVDHPDVNCAEFSHIREDSRQQLLNEKIEELIDKGYIEFTREAATVRMLDIQDDYLAEYENCEVEPLDSVVTKAVLGICLILQHNLKGVWRNGDGEPVELKSVNVTDILHKNKFKNNILIVPGFIIKLTDEQAIDAFMNPEYRAKPHENCLFSRKDITDIKNEILRKISERYTHSTETNSAEKMIDLTLSCAMDDVEDVFEKYEVKDV